MRVALVRPPSILKMLGKHSLQHPINLCYIAAQLLQDKIDVRIYDYEIAGGRHSAPLHDILTYNPDVAGFTAMTPNIEYAHEIASKIKQYNNKIITVIGGAHASACPEKTLEDFANFDVAVKGEGEKTMLTLCSELEKNQSLKSIQEIPNIIFRYNGEIKNYLNGQYTAINLETQPFPTREILHLNKYKKLAATPGLPESRNGTQLFTVRGCYANCIFCASKNIFGKEIRQRSLDSVLSEMEECKNKFGFSHFTIDDDAFTVNYLRILEFCERVKKLNVTWDCDTRVDIINAEIASAMAKSGCKKIAFGVESGSKKILKLIGKRVTIEQIKNAFKIVQKHGISSSAFFMIGSHPEETEDDIELTRCLALEIMPDTVSFFVATPFPNTELYRLLSQEKLIECNKWSDYNPFFGKPKWRTKYISSTELVIFQNYLFRSFYLNPRYIINKIRNTKNLPHLFYWFMAGLTFIKFQIKRSRDK